MKGTGLFRGITPRVGKCSLKPAWMSSFKEARRRGKRLKNGMWGKDNKMYMKGRGLNRKKGCCAKGTCRAL